jgi:hypothetical protein
VAGHHPRRIQTQLVDSLKTGTGRPFPTLMSACLPYLQHSFWFMPNVASCHAMANLLAEKTQHVLARLQSDSGCWGSQAGIGLDALTAGAQSDRRRLRHKDHHTVLRQADHRRDRAAVVVDHDAAKPEVAGDLLPGGVSGSVALVDQESQRRQSERGGGPEARVLRVRLRADSSAAPAVRVRHRPVTGESNPEHAVKELVSFLPVLAYDGANMTQIDAGGILDIAMAGTSATLLARKWESALLVNVDNDTLRRVLDNPEAMAAVERIEGLARSG